MVRKENGFDQISRKAQDFPPPVKSCSPLMKVVDKDDGLGPEIWVVRGDFVMKGLFRLPVTMTIIRCPDGGLMLVNAIRVPEEVEKEILALGKVRHVVKLGQFHGYADAYYCLCRKFESPKLWTLPGGTTAPGIEADRIMDGDANLPYPGASLYVLEPLPYKEAVMYIPHPRGDVLLVCDCLGKITPEEIHGFLSRILWWKLGFFQNGEHVMPPAIWIKDISDGCSLEHVPGWFQDIFHREFRYLFMAHGAPVVDLDSHEIGKYILNHLH